MWLLLFSNGHGEKGSSATAIDFDDNPCNSVWCGTVGPRPGFGVQKPGVARHYSCERPAFSHLCWLCTRIWSVGRMMKNDPLLQPEGGDTDDTIKPKGNRNTHLTASTWKASRKPVRYIAQIWSDRVRLFFQCYQTDISEWMQIGARVTRLLSLPDILLNHLGLCSRGLLHDTLRPDAPWHMPLFSLYPACCG